MKACVRRRTITAEEIEQLVELPSSPQPASSAAIVAAFDASAPLSSSLSHYRVVTASPSSSSSAKRRRLEDGHAATSTTASAPTYLLKHIKSDRSRLLTARGDNANLERRVQLLEDEANKREKAEKLREVEETAQRHLHDQYEVYNAIGQDLNDRVFLALEVLSPADRTLLRQAKLSYGPTLVTVAALRDPWGSAHEVLDRLPGKYKQDLLRKRWDERVQNVWTKVAGALDNLDRDLLLSLGIGRLTVGETRAVTAHRAPTGSTALNIVQESAFFSPSLKEVAAQLIRDGLQDEKGRPLLSV